MFTSESTGKVSLRPGSINLLVNKEDLMLEKLRPLDCSLDPLNL
jgi:hypothetical protein